MPHRSKEYLQKVIEAIEDFQFQEFLSDRELSLKAWLSATMISKIKKWTTIPKLSTLKKLKVTWVLIPKPSREIVKATLNHWESTDNNT